MISLSSMSGVWTDRVYPALPKVIEIIIGLAILFVFYRAVTKILQKLLLAKAKTKSEKNNAVVVIRIWEYFFFFFIALAAIFLYTGSLTGLGISAGLLTAALGWALQRPITGIAAWVMIVVKKPFQIGDRILIGDVKGDVTDITLTHVYLKEIGGTIATEEISGRVVMIPNSVLFEKNIINYTMQDDLILDQIEVLVSYGSNIEKIIGLAVDAAEKCTKEWAKRVPNPHVRTYFSESGLRVITRYFTKVEIRTRVSSDITYLLLKEFRKHKDIEIAYPHRYVLFGGKKK